MRARLVLLIALISISVGAGAASAEASDPGWEVTSNAYPTNLPPGGTGILEVDVYNVGAAQSAGTITVTDTLPPGLTAIEAGNLNPGEGIGHTEWACSGTTVVTCTNEPGALPSIPVGKFEVIGIAVNVLPRSSPAVESNQVTVAGGGAASNASTSEPTTISSTPATFGFAEFDGWFTTADGSTDTQAGSHPYELTVDFDDNSISRSGVIEPAGEPRDMTVDLPPGLTGDPNAVPKCTRQQFDGGGISPLCPASSQIGIATVELGGFEKHPSPIVVGVYNLAPPSGVPAEFGFYLAGIHAFLDASVRTGGDYGITEHIDNTPQRHVVGASVTLWGVPADPSHNAERCEDSTPGCPSGAPSIPFLTMPSACAGAQELRLSADSWQEPNLFEKTAFTLHDESGSQSGINGCGRLDFSPALSVKPDTETTDSPAGLAVDLQVPQNESPLRIFENSEVNYAPLAEADVKSVTMTLPEGVAVSPSAAGGLGVCTEEEIGLQEADVPSCPEPSQIGSMEIATPILEKPLVGAVYVAQQGNNPFGSLLAVYVVAEGDGVLIKLAGEVHLDQSTGQLTVTFDNTPQQPFSNLRLDLFGGQRAALVTPHTCGSYVTTSRMTGYNEAVAEPSSGLAIAAGCTSGFNPTFSAGTANNQAGGFSSFSVTFSRQGGEPTLSSASVTTPPGLLGVLKNVPLCGEPQAEEGKCGEQSRIGEATVAAGPGSDPYWVKGGRVYLTGPYGGRPFGLSIVVPAIAGPFNLGNEIVRAAIGVDRHTGQITVASAPLPTILQGIPLDVRTVNVTINRSEFIFNPTSCLPLSVTGTIGASTGASAGVATPFEAANCANLPFKPSLAISTQAKTSRVDGASLTVEVKSAAGQANIGKVDLQLPKALPARLATLQKACTEASFNANPADCPPASVIGTATAITPILRVPLTGPAYLVSHGGAAFPDVVFMLQGEGVQIELDGKTDIKQGIVYSKFETVPDAPISSFETRLPEGPHSVLTANLPAKARHSLCGRTLTAPTTITGQNGAQIEQTTKVTVEGCQRRKRKGKPRGK